MANQKQKGKGQAQGTSKQSSGARGGTRQSGQPSSMDKEQGGGRSSREEE